MEDSTSHGIHILSTYSYLFKTSLLQCFAYKIEHSYFFKLFVLAKYDDKSYQI